MKLIPAQSRRWCEILIPVFNSLFWWLMLSDKGVVLHGFSFNLGNTLQINYCSQWKKKKKGYFAQLSFIYDCISWFNALDLLILLFYLAVHQQQDPSMWVWSCSRILPVKRETFLPLSLVWGTASGFLCRTYRENLDCNWHDINNIGWEQ